MSATTLADVYVGEVAKSTCRALKGKDFKDYMRSAMGDMKLEVTYEKDGSCGESLYIMKKANRKRFIVFPNQQGCECYLKTVKALSKPS